MITGDSNGFTIYNSLEAVGGGLKWSKVVGGKLRTFRKTSRSVADWYTLATSLVGSVRGLRSLGGDSRRWKRFSHSFVFTHSCPKMLPGDFRICFTIR